MSHLEVINTIELLLNGQYHTGNESQHRVSCVAGLEVIIHLFLWVF